MPEPITPETEVWNVEPERYAPHFVSKYHLAREGDCIAKCSPRIILNLPLDHLYYTLGRLEEIERAASERLVAVRADDWTRCALC